MPTDMRALQDFDEPDKLKIHANDIITIIEGRSACHLCLFFHLNLGKPKRHECTLKVCISAKSEYAFSDKVQSNNT